MDKTDLELKRLLEWEKGLLPPPADAVARAKALKPLAAMPCPHCGKSVSAFKSPLSRQKAVSFVWLAASVASFALSFVFRAYFFQCLAAAVICGFKWAIDQKAIKAQIFVYQSLQRENVADHQDLHRHESHL